jgi:formylglycine-generating enzyme required for sulfatase activity
MRELVADELSDPDRTEGLVNTVQVGEAEDAAAADILAQRLAYLTWGLEPVVANQLSEPMSTDKALQQQPSAGQLRVWLLTPGRSGSPFSDSLSEPLSETQLQRWRNPPESLKPADPSQQAEQELVTEQITAPEPTLIQDKLSDGTPAPEMLVLPAGSFLMGSPDDEPGRSSDEDPRHTVKIASFAIGRTEVTFEQYDRFARATDRKLPDDWGWGRGNRPVINVSWADATAYAVWLSEQTGQRYRLPSEAEWEYAARAGTPTPFSTGDCIHTDQVNYNGEYDYADCGAKTGLYRGKTVPAGSLRANPWGLHEVHGNVWEWVQDCWHPNYEGAPKDGTAWEAGGDCALRVVRGGGWSGDPVYLRSAFRGRFSADGAIGNLGFRLARTL